MCNQTAMTRKPYTSCAQTANRFKSSSAAFKHHHLHNCKLGKINSLRSNRGFFTCPFVVPSLTVCVGVRCLSKVEKQDS